MKDFKLQYGQWALITGASSGFGAEFARQLSRKKLNLVLVARNRDRLEQLSEEVRRQNEIEVKIVVADLTQREGIKTVQEQTEELEIGASCK